MGGGGGGHFPVTLPQRFSAAITIRNHAPHIQQGAAASALEQAATAYLLIPPSAAPSAALSSPQPAATDKGTSAPVRGSAHSPLPTSLPAAPDRPRAEQARSLGRRSSRCALSAQGARSPNARRRLCVGGCWRLLQPHHTCDSVQTMQLPFTAPAHGRH